MKKNLKKDLYSKRNLKRSSLHTLNVKNKKTDPYVTPKINSNTDKNTIFSFK